MNLSTKRDQIITLLVILTGLIVLILVPYGLQDFLYGIGHSEPASLALLISVIGVIFILLHEFGLRYKEDEIDLGYTTT